jgi:hypothetical protein
MKKDGVQWQGEGVVYTCISPYINIPTFTWQNYQNQKKYSMLNYNHLYHKSCIRQK